MIANEIYESLRECVDLSFKPGTYPMLPSIVECLEKMHNIVSDGQWNSRDTRWGAGLGRLVMDDFSFSESELGTRLLNIADSWCKKGN